MASKSSSINFESVTMEFLNIIYHKFTEDTSGPFMLKFKDGECVAVEVYHNFAYRVCKKGLADLYCVVYRLDFNVTNAKRDDRAQLLMVERQKRGLPHVTLCNALVITETEYSLKSVEQITNEKQ